jgi:hypothetical protein
MGWFPKPVCPLVIASGKPQRIEGSHDGTPQIAFVNDKRGVHKLKFKLKFKLNRAKTLKIKDL